MAGANWNLNGCLEEGTAKNWDLEQVTTAGTWMCREGTHNRWILLQGPRGTWGLWRGITAIFALW